jgi:hypothetical protein
LVEQLRFRIGHLSAVLAIISLVLYNSRYPCSSYGLYAWILRFLQVRLLSPGASG